MKKKCLHEETLADYFERRLSSRERAVVEAHLSECNACLEDFVITRNLVRNGARSELKPVTPRVTQSAVNLVDSQMMASASRLKGRVENSLKGLYSCLSDVFSLRSLEDWKLAPIRGSRRLVTKDLIHLRKVFKEIDTEMEIEKIGEDRAHIRIRVLEERKYKKRCRVTLIKGEREISSQLLNDDDVLFEDIPFGHYTLTFSRDGQVIGKYPFEIKESSKG